MNKHVRSYGEYSVQLTIASLICSIGFLTNSETVVIGSMLISPVGGAILGMLDPTKNRIRRSFDAPVRLLIAVSICVFTGFIIGVCVPMTGKEEENETTSVVQGRGKALAMNPWLLLSGSVVALLGGLLFNYKNMATSIGLGIATALLPPLVAAGFYLGRMSSKYKKMIYSGKDVGFAFANFSCNVIGILVCAILVHTQGVIKHGNTVKVKATT